jgi:hypothetical protein
MELLIPKTIRGWIASISTLILAFVLYYVFLFPYLERFYRGFLYTERVSPERSEIIKGLTMRLDVPNYLASYGQRWLYFTIRNDTDHPISDLWIGLEVQKGEKRPYVEGWVFPFLYAGSTSVERSMYIEHLQPGLSFSGRLPLYGSAFGSVPSELTATVIIMATSGITNSGAGEPVALAKFPLSVKINSWRYLAHSFIEQILLPPWSNGVIVVAVFIVCTQLERRLNPKEECYRWLWKAIRSSFMLLLAMGGVLLTLPAIPWGHQDISGFLMALLFFISMLYSLKWAIGINLPPLPSFGQHLKNRRLNLQINVKIPLRISTAMPNGYVGVFALTILWIIGLWLLKPQLPLLQPLPWMVLAAAALRALDIFMHFIYSEGNYGPKRSNS